LPSSPMAREAHPTPSFVKPAWPGSKRVQPLPLPAATVAAGEGIQQQQQTQTDMDNRAMHFTQVGNDDYSKTTEVDMLRQFNHCARDDLAHPLCGQRGLGSPTVQGFRKPPLRERQ